MLFRPLLMEVWALCYQPLCNSCFHRTIIFKFVAAKILLQSKNIDVDHLVRKFCDIPTVSVSSLVMKLWAMWTYFLTDHCASACLTLFYHHTNATGGQKNLSCIPVMKTKGYQSFCIINFVTYWQSYEYTYIFLFTSVTLCTAFLLHSDHSLHYTLAK